MKQTNPKLTARNALDLSEAFYQDALALHDYIYANWEKISKSNRDKLRSQRRTLLNHADNLITDAVGIVLDEGQYNLKELIKTTKKANKTLKKIKSVRKAIKVTAALILLAAAIQTNNPGAIIEALSEVKDSM